MIIITWSQLQTTKFEEEVRGRVTNCCFSHSRATPDELAMEYGVPAGTFNLNRAKKRNKK